MELTDVAQRIFKRHWALILILGILGALAPLVLLQIQGPTYIGTARFVIGSDPRTTQTSTSDSDTALGLATNPALMATVMKETHIQRDPLLLAPNITVTPVGTSGVLDLAVNDSDARASAALANGLATEIVKERTATLLGNTQQLINQTDVQIGIVNARIAAIENASHGYMTPGDSAAVALRHADALAVRASLTTQRQQLSQLLVTTPAPQLLNASAKTGIEDTSTLIPEIAVGALLGLIVGIAVAATREASHPTYGREALARRFDVPVLGRLSHAPSAGMKLADPWLAHYVKVAAEEAGVRSVQLVAAGHRPVDVTGLARNLSESGVDVTALVLPGRRGVHAMPTAVRHLDAGIVVVTPELIKSKYLLPIDRHLQVTHQPVLGIITFHGRPERSVPETITAEEPESRPQAERPSAAVHMSVRPAESTS